MAAAADPSIGATRKSSIEYGLAYRFTSHKALKEIRKELAKQQPRSALQPYLPAGGFGADFLAFATPGVVLQEKRHLADYDPLAKIKLADAALAIVTADSTIERWVVVPDPERRTFVALLVLK